MARRVNPAAGTAATEEHDEQTPMEGGSAGVIVSEYKAIANSGHTTATAYRPPAEDAPPPPLVRRYIVENAGSGKSVLLNGYKALFKDGKVVDDVNYNIDGLKQQGVRLRELE